MEKYLDSLNSEIREYFRILCPEFPSWLLEYIDTPAMSRIGGISLNCGTDYSGCFHSRYWYSNLDHSVGVALIIWNFTHDMRQTLSGLFHDIATPVFKHCIDFMNGDHENQESTEERTCGIIKNSREIMCLLERDGIELSEVCDYKLYPIADNPSPRLSADRFEYNFSSGLTFFRVWELNSIKRVYGDITLSRNEDGAVELAFAHKDICEEYIDTVSKLWPQWVSDKDRTVMQFIADMCASMCAAGYLTVDDLYSLSEAEVINRILNCSDGYLSSCFRRFQQEDTVYRSDTKVEDRYCVKVKSKTRYIDPLVCTENGAKRVSKSSSKAKAQIDGYLYRHIDGEYYTCFDFQFRPYNISSEAPANKAKDM